VGAGYDVAVIELEKPLTDELTAGRVCMPLKPITEHVGKTATLAGWGRTKNDSSKSYPTLLQSLDMKVLKDCMKVPKEVGLKK
jgi:Trypsin